MAFIAARGVGPLPGLDVRCGRGGGLLLSSEWIDVKAISYRMLRRIIVVGGRFYYYICVRPGWYLRRRVVLGFQPVVLDKISAVYRIIHGIRIGLMLTRIRDRQLT